MFTADEWQLQQDIQQHRCYWCKKRFTKKRPPTIDHLIAIAAGGQHVASNIVAACGSCNSRKFTKRLVLL